MQTFVYRFLLFWSILFSVSTTTAQTLNNEKVVDYIQDQKYAEAASYIRSVYPNEIADTKLLLRLAYCYYMSGQLSEAEDSYSRVLVRDSTYRPALTYLANIQKRRGNTSKTRDYYLKIARLDSTNFMVYQELADLSLKMNDRVAMFNYLQKANRLNPTDPDVASDYSGLLLKQKKFGKMDTVLDIAMRADTLNIFLIKMRMELASALKNYPLTVSLAEKAIRLGDTDAQTISLLGRSYYYLNRYQKAIDTYAILENLSNLANEGTFYYTALSYRQLKNIPKSNEYLQKSIVDGISANIPVYYQELSINSEMQKNYRTGITQLDRAETFDAKNIFNYSRARIYDENLGDRVKALKYYKRYVKAYKEDIDQNKDGYVFAVYRIGLLSGTTTDKK